jgi:DNA (cytosine-5)-methyltransferase 1
MKIGSLCSGYGGLDMGVQSVLGGEVAWVSEFDKNVSKIIQHNHPTIENHGDLTKINWQELEPVDVITAGYPCQPFSAVGKRKGTNDPRHIWPYIRDGIDTIRPKLVLLENVAGHLTLGFDSVLGSLSEIGYDARWHCLRASEIGAPHNRLRLFIVAYPKGSRWWTQQDCEITGFGSSRNGMGSVNQSDSGTVTNSNSINDGQRRLRILDEKSETTEQDSNSVFRFSNSDNENKESINWGDFAAAIKRWEHIRNLEAPNPIDKEGRLSAHFVEWMMGLRAGLVTDVDIPRNAQIKALGNGVVPQQAAEALTRLLKMDKENNE